MKNMFLLLVLLVNFALSASAQTSKGSVGLIGSADFYNFEFKPDLQTGAMYDDIFNYSGGLEGGYHFTDSFSGSLGLVGSKKGFEKEYISPIIDETYQEQLRTTRLDIYYLDIPVLFDYDFYLNEKVSVFASAGAVPGILLDDKEVSNYVTDTDRQTDFMNHNLNKVVLAGQVSGGFKLQVYDTKSIRIEPYFRKYFNKMAPDLMTENPNSYGIQIGIFQHF